MERHEVVDHRRADTAALRRIHPVAEVEDVEGADDVLERRPAEPRPRGAQRMRGRHDRQAPLRSHAVERALDHPPAGPRHRREGDDVVRASLCQAEQRSADVVADARPRMGQRRDVDDDLHGV